MKKILFWLCVLAILPIGDIMIKHFDDAGLKELNNRLTKYEKIIQKLNKQISVGVVGASTEIEEDTDFVPEITLDDDGVAIEDTLPVIDDKPISEMTPKEKRQAKHAAKKAKREAKKAEKQARKAEKKMLREGTSVTTQIMAGSDTGYKEVKVPLVTAMGQMQEDGRVDLYNPNAGETRVINIAPISYVGKTQAKIAVPSSYFLDLRGYWVSTSQRKYTADVIVLHDVLGKTVTLTNVDETNDINDAQTASVAGKRDQAAAFTASTWIYFFIIYNSVTGDVSSLSSASPTTPTFPTGYDYFVRAGCARLDSGGNLVTYNQIGNHFSDWTFVKNNLAPGTADVWESIDISAAIPPTAIMFWGVYGITDTLGSAQSIAVSSVNSITRGVGTRILSGNPGASSTYHPAFGGFFNLIVDEAQTMYWIATSNSANFGIKILGFLDDL